MIESGFIDWIVSTGANVYHDLHFAYDLPVRQGYHDVDDDVLYENQIVRIYDTYIKEVGTLQAQDVIIQRNMIGNKKSNILSSSLPFRELRRAARPGALDRDRRRVVSHLGAPAQPCPFVVSPSYAFTYHLGEAG
jgi:hypothetical protein